MLRGHTTRSICEWASAAAQTVESLLPSSEGALLFRGLPLSTPVEFRDFVDALEWQRVEYEPMMGKRCV